MEMFRYWSFWLGLCLFADKRNNNSFGQCYHLQNWGLADFQLMPPVQWLESVEHFLLLNGCLLSTIKLKWIVNDFCQRNQLLYSYAKCPEMWLQYLFQIFGILFSLRINERTFGNLEVQMGVLFEMEDEEKIWYLT